MLIIIDEQGRKRFIGTKAQFIAQTKGRYLSQPAEGVTVRGQVLPSRKSLPSVDELIRASITGQAVSIQTVSVASSAASRYSRAECRVARKGPNRKAAKAHDPNWGHRRLEAIAIKRHGSLLVAPEMA